MQIIPKSSIGPVAIGMSRDQYEAVFGPSTDRFQRADDSPPNQEWVVAYDASGFHLAIDSSERIETITVFPPNSAVLEGIQLLRRSFTEVTEELRRGPHVWENVDAGLWSEELGVCLVEVDGIVDSVELYG